MALPVTISGISVAPSCVGPFKMDGTVILSATPAGALTAFAIGISSAARDRAGFSFTTAATTAIAAVSVLAGKNGSPSDNLTAYIFASSGGLPTGAALATSNSIAASAFSTAGAWVQFTFPTPYTPSASTTYCMVFGRSGGFDATNNFTIGAVASGTSFIDEWSFAWHTTSFDAIYRIHAASGTDKFFFFGRDGTTNTTLQCFKSTAPDTSWASVASNTGFSGGITKIAGTQYLDIIHLAVMDGTSNSAVNVKYRTFNMATEAFVVSETVQSAFDPRDSGTGGITDCSIALRPSDGQTTILYNGARVAVMGTSYARIVYARRTGVATWTTNVAVDAAGAFDYDEPQARLGASNRIQFFWHLANGSSFLNRSLNSSNTLGTQGSQNFGSSVRGYTDAVSYDASGTQKFVATREPGSTVEKFNDADNPTVSTAGTSMSGAQAPVRLFNDGTDVYIIEGKFSDSDLYVTKSTDHGATWGSETNIFTGTVSASTANLSIDAQVYQRGSNFVFPYIVNDNGTIKYNEYIVRSTGVVATATQSLGMGQTATATVDVKAAATQSLGITQTATDTVAVKASATQSLSIAQTADVSTASSISATATQSLGMGQTATAAVDVKATATQSLSIAQTATDTVDVKATAAQSLAIAQTATDTVDVKATATQSLSIAQTATDTVDVKATATQSLSIAQTADVSTATTAFLIAAQSLGMGQTATATVDVKASATQSLAIAQTATDTVDVKATATQSLAIAQTATDTVDVKATATQSLAIAQTAIAIATASNVATQSLTMAQTATAAVTVQAAATQSLGILQTATDTVTVQVAATQSLGINQTATDTVAVKATATQSLAIAQIAQMAGASIAADAAQSLAMAQTATATVDVKATATQSLLIGQTATDTVAVKATATQSLLMAQTATDTVDVKAAATQSLLIGQTATVAAANGALVASQSLAMAQTATATVAVKAAATQSLGINQTATDTVAVKASATQSLSMTQDATAIAPRSLTATQTLSIVQSATAIAPASNTAAQSLGINQTATGKVGVAALAVQPLGINQAATAVVALGASALNSFTISQIATAHVPLLSANIIRTIVVDISARSGTSQIRTRGGSSTTRARGGSATIRGSDNI